MLKKQVADKYNLDFSKMDDNEYKLSKPKHLNGLTVRDVLIKEGCSARSIWEDVWANSVYQEILNSGKKIGIVSDYRFPNEYGCFDRSFDFWSSLSTSNNEKPKIIRILVHRPNGIFKNDGADGELPDIESPESWDYIVINNDIPGWKNVLQENVLAIMQMEKIL